MAGVLSDATGDDQPPPTSRCIICHEEDPEPPPIPCPRCKDTRAHAQCLLPWIIARGSCPTCRTWLLREAGPLTNEDNEEQQEQQEEDEEEEQQEETVRERRLYLWPCLTQMMHLVFGMLMFVTVAEFPQTRGSAPRHRAQEIASNLLVALYLVSDSLLFALMLVTEGAPRRTGDDVYTRQGEGEPGGEPRGEPRGGEASGEQGGEPRGEAGGEQGGETGGEAGSEAHSEAIEGEAIVRVRGPPSPAARRRTLSTPGGGSPLSASAPYLVLCGYVFLCGATATGAAAMLDGWATGRLGAEGAEPRSGKAMLPGEGPMLLLHLTYLVSAHSVLSLYAVPAILSPCPLWRAQYLCLSLVYGLMLALMKTTADTGVLLGVVLSLGAFFFSLAAAAGV